MDGGVAVVVLREEGVERAQIPSEIGGSGKN